MREGLAASMSASQVVGTRGLRMPASQPVPIPKHVDMLMGGWLGGHRSELKLCCGVAEGARGDQPTWLWVEVCWHCHQAGLGPQPELAWT